MRWRCCPASAARPSSSLPPTTCTPSSCASRSTVSRCTIQCFSQLSLAAAAAAAVSRILGWQSPILEQFMKPMAAAADMGFPKFLAEAMLPCHACPARMGKPCDPEHCQSRRSCLLMGADRMCRLGYPTAACQPTISAHEQAESRRWG